MVVTPGDLGVAMAILGGLEGFRRVEANGVVFTRWRGQWRAGSSPFCLWLKGIAWLWLAPWHASPRTFVCQSDAPPCGRGAREAVEAVKRRIHTLTREHHRLSILTRVEAVLILVVLPAAAVVGTHAVIYMGLGLSIAGACLIAAAVWRREQWHAITYALYPPSSLFALAKNTTGELGEFGYDAVVAALLPDREAAVRLRRWYRAARFGPDRDEGAADFVAARAAELVRLRGLDAAAVMGDPARSSESAVSFCPCCDAEFLMASGECADCPGVALVEFPAPAGARRPL